MVTLFAVDLVLGICLGFGSGFLGSFLRLLVSLFLTLLSEGLAPLNKRLRVPAAVRYVAYIVFLRPLLEIIHVAPLGLQRVTGSKRRQCEVGDGCSG